MRPGFVFTCPALHSVNFTERPSAFLFFFFFSSSFFFFFPMYHTYLRGLWVEGPVYIINMVYTAPVNKRIIRECLPFAYRTVCTCPRAIS